MPPESGIRGNFGRFGSGFPLEALEAVGAQGTTSGVEYGLAPIPTRVSMLGAPMGGGEPQATRTPAAMARDSAARGDVLFLSGQFKPAFDHFQECVRLQPAEAEYHFKLAVTAARLGQPQWVEPHYRHAIRLNPNHAPAHKALAQLAIQCGDVVTALPHSLKALELVPGDIDSIAIRAVVLMAGGEAESAWQLLSPLIASGSDDLQLAYAYARLAPMIGHEQQAADLVARALRRRDLSPTYRARLSFAAAGLLDAIGRHEEAFFHAKAANALARQPFNSAAYTELVSRNINYFTREHLRALPRASLGSRRPVFIVGMPRSGTTLVEQILASHSAVFGGGELSLVADLTQAIATAPWTEGAPLPQCLDALTLQDAHRLATRYLEVIGSLNSTARYVTDKMPLNFQAIGLIQILFPDCHIIHCVRDPRDTCLSCYFIDFAFGNEFTYDLGHLAAFHRDYARMMEHWKRVLPSPMLEVRYEDVVADKEGQTRRMLEFLNLPWEAGCLEFNKNKRHVATASRDQVRKPIYASSVGRWKHYEKHIPELMSLPTL
jgi:tetratricopeptide (TPR) repeat protein